MTALTPALKIALGVINVAAEMMVAAREAEEVIKAEGADELPEVIVSTSRLAREARTILSTDAVQAAIDQERQRRAEADD